MLHRTATPNAAFTTQRERTHCVMECCAINAKSVTVSPVKFWFNQPIDPSLEGKNYWVLKIQDGTAAGVIFLVLVIGSV